MPIECSRAPGELGFVVLLAPSYLGHQGGVEGWYQEMLKSGPQKLHDYGRYLGRRYQNFMSIIWLHGGDYDPPDKDIVRAIVNGIREIQPTALHSAHGSPERLHRNTGAENRGSTSTTFTLTSPLFTLPASGLPKLPRCRFS
jgi:hypothetical protein